jgi:arabinogalactan endo-1,4-beta-galactosidase
MTEPFRMSLSLSAFTELLLAQGHHFRDGDTVVTTPEDLQRLFVAHGSNEVFVRVPTRRHTGNASPVDWVVGSLDIALDRARLAASLGLRFNPEFGLFRHYGDALRQPAPDFSDHPEIQLSGPWHTLTVDEMAAAIETYGGIVAREIAATGAEVGVWDIGNEVDTGVAGISPRPAPSGVDAIIDRGEEWYAAPDRVDPEVGRTSLLDLVRRGMDELIPWLERHVWPHQARLLAAFADGVRSVVPDARFGTHLAAHAAVDARFPLAFWEAMAAGGYRPDVIGTSFYPSNGQAPSGDAFEDFRRTVATLQDKLQRPVFVSEYGYPATGDAVWEGWDRPVPCYPLTEDGQAALLHDIVAWGHANGMSGVRPWLPDGFVGVWGLATMALFGPADPAAVCGASRPALTAIADALG